MSEVSLALYLAVFGVLILHRDPAVRKTRTITWTALLTSAFLNCESSKWTWHQHNQSKRPSHKLRNTKSHSTNTRWAETLYIHTYIHIYIYIYNVCSVTTESLQPRRLWPLQARLSMEFSRKKCWNWLPFPTPGDLPDSGIKPTSLESPAQILYH